MILDKKCDIYISSCDKDGGICHFKTDGNGGVVFKKMYRADRPMYLIKDGGKLYCLLREPFSDSENSGLVSYDISGGGSLENPSEPITTHGKVACHLCSADGSIYCVNYVSGSVVKMPDTVDVHSGCGTHPTRQEAAHTHFVTPSPDGKYIFATDLGIDKIFVYDKDLNKVSDVKMPDGCGPRHLAFHPDGEHVFCVNELDSTVSCLKYSDGSLEYLSSIQTLPNGFTAKNTAAAIRYVNGKVYVSHRGYDKVVVLGFDGKRLTVENEYSAYGKAPRDMWTDGKTIICTNQDSDNITFVSAESGELLYDFKAKCPISVIVSES